MKSSHIIVFSVFALLITGCNGQTKTNSIKDCEFLYKQANSKLNEYHLTNNDSCLDLSLKYTEEALSICSEYIVRLSDLKITLLMLLRKYKEGYEFVNLMNDNDFDKPYKKSMYLKTFNAFYFESQGNTLRRDSCFKDIEIEIKTYLSKNPSDNDATADLFFTKAKHTDIEIVIKEIEFLQEKDQENVDFLEGLKGTIKYMPK